MQDFVDAAHSSTMLLKTKRPRTSAGAEAIFGVEAHSTAPRQRTKLPVQITFFITISTLAVRRGFDRQV
jgi:hypothetical protein